MGSDKKNSGRISNFEWGFVVGIMLMIDIVEFVIDFFVVGAIINRFVDFLCAGGLIFYVKIRRAYMDTRAWTSIGGAFVGEMIPVVDALPLWTLDAIYLWSINGTGMATMVANKALAGQVSGEIDSALKGGVSQPPVINQKPSPNKAPSKIPDGRQPLPRRIPPEPGPGE